MITATVTYKGSSYTVTKSETSDHVELSKDGVGVGSGVWSGGRIEDCGAVLQETPEETEELYDALDAAIAAALS